MIRPEDTLTCAQHEKPCAACGQPTFFADETGRHIHVGCFAAELAARRGLGL